MICKRKYGHLKTFYGNRGFLSGGVPTPSFSVLSDGSITPTIGTAGTFSRTGAMLCPASKTTLTSVSSGTACTNAFAQGVNAPTHTLGGYYGVSAIVNYLPEASTFDNWDLIGTPTVTTGQSDPASGTAADEVAGGTAGDGIEDVSSLTSTSNRVVFMVWARSGSSDSFTMDVTDDGTFGSGGSASHSATRAWQMYTVLGTFDGTASGNVVCELIVDTGTVEFYGAGLFQVDLDNTTSLGHPWDFTPTIITTGSSTNVGRSLLYYSGSELTAASVKKSVSVWFYMPSYNRSVSFTDLWICHGYGPSFAKVFQIMLHVSSAQIRCSFGSSTEINIGLQTSYITGDQWNNITLVIDDGDNEAYVNGTSMYTNTNAVSSSSLERFVLGSQWHCGAAASVTFRSIIGQTDVWIGSRLNDIAVSDHYNNTKGNYGIS